MENIWLLAAVWVGLALIATLIAIWFKVSTALSEIVVGTAAQLVIGAFFVHGELGSKTPWITFLAGTGAIVLTFLAGTELDPQVFRAKWKEAIVAGLVGRPLEPSTFVELQAVLNDSGSTSRKSLRKYAKRRVR